MSQKQLKRRMRKQQRQAMAVRVQTVYAKAAAAAKECQPQSVVWGIMVGLSSLALGAYNPALGQDWEFQPQDRKQDGQKTGKGVTPRSHHSDTRSTQDVTRQSTWSNRIEDANRTHRFAMRLAALQQNAEGSRQRIDIPAGNLQSALLVLSGQMDLQLLYPSELIVGLQTQGVQGMYTSEEALSELLSGTPLKHQMSDAATATLVQAIKAQSEEPLQDGVMNLLEDDTVIQADPIVIEEEITRSKVFLPPVDGYRADQTTVSTRSALPINETPTSIGVVTRDIIKDTYSRTQNDAFENVSGVARGNTSRGARTEGFSIRGFTGANREGSFGAIRSNGLPTGTSFAMDPAFIERYEIIKGPASITGGASSPGGLVNRILKSPQDTNFATSNFEAGSFDLYRGVVDVNGVLPQNKNVRGRLIFAVEEGGHFVDDIDVRQYTIAPSLEIDLFGGAGTLLLTGHYQNFDGSNYSGFPLLENGKVPNIRRTRPIGGGSSNGAKFTFKKQDYELHYNHEFVHNLKLSMKGKYVKSDQSDKYVYAYGYSFDTYGPGVALNGAAPIYASRRTNNWETYAGEIFLNKEFEMLGQSHEVLLGIDHRDQTLGVTVGYAGLGTDNIFNPVNNFQIPSNSVLEANPFPTSPRTSKIKQTGLFGQAIVRPIAPLTLVAAGRYDWAEASRETSRALSNGKENFSEFTGRVGATYAVLPDLRVYAGYSQSFQVNIISTTVDGALVPPETGESYEVGAKLDLLDGRLRLTTALFRAYRQNVATTDPDNPQFSIAVGEQRHQGVEFDVNGQPWPGLNLTANISYLDAEITESNIAGSVGETPILIPRSYIGKVFATYKLQSGLLQGLGFGGGVFFQSGYELQLPNRFKTDSYERVDAVVFYRPPQKAYDFTINVRNLLDATYIESASGLDIGNQFGAPVSVFGTLRVKFSPDLDWSLW